MCLFDGCDRPGRALMQRVEEQMGLRSDRAVASTERASASAEFFMDTGPTAENDNVEDDRDEDDQHDVDDEDQQQEEEEEEEEEDDDDDDDQEQEDEEPAPQRPSRARKPAARGDGFVDPTSPGLSFATPSARKSPSNSGKRKVSERIEELDLAAAKEEKEGANERQPRKTRRSAKSSSTAGSAKKKSRTRSQRK
jgi:hypothetical protein